MVDTQSSQARNRSNYETPERVASDLSSQTDKYSPEREKRNKLRTHSRLPPSIEFRTTHHYPSTSSPKDVISIHHMLSEEDDVKVDTATDETREKIAIEVSPSRVYSSLKREQLEELQSRIRRRDNSKNESQKAIGKEEKALLELRNASEKIGSVLLDLDDLRFFHELDIESSPSINFKSRIPQKFLSPRHLSAMERSTLELEAQELQRKLDIVHAEKHELAVKIQMYEQQAKARSEEGDKINSLEKKLVVVRNALSEQVNKIHQSREKLIEEFDEKLNLVNDNNLLLRTEAEIMANELSRTQIKHEFQLKEFADDLKDAQDMLQTRSAEKENLKEEVAELRLELDAFNKELLDNRILLEERQSEYIQLDEEHHEALTELESASKEIASLKAKIKHQTKKIDGLKTTVEDLVEREQMRNLMCSFI